MPDGGGYPYPEDFAERNRLREEIARLRRELEEERARMDWLCSAAGMRLADKALERPAAWFVYVLAGDTPSLREAIDAARKAEGENDA